LRPGLSTLGFGGGWSNLERERSGPRLGPGRRPLGSRGGGASCCARVSSSSSPFALRDLSSRGIASDLDASRKDFQARLATDHKEVGGTRKKK
jgi:hypothetical protein